MVHDSKDVPVRRGLAAQALGFGGAKLLSKQTFNIRTFRYDNLFIHISNSSVYYF